MLHVVEIYFVHVHVSYGSALVVLVGLYSADVGAFDLVHVADRAGPFEHRFLILVRELPHPGIILKDLKEIVLYLLFVLIHLAFIFLFHDVFLLGIKGL